ncbi:MAG: hypothetical protein OHM77_11960 [Candidatus Nitricoxidivorans perseverans]|uniref:Lipoprotein n=1 Tax=Candidatus Nitricoxidivorans perseverans TaxID=2975601 RepID=A0AA49IYF6_9PROT|nr:MAG: hypothetical protein OHM77_11960 [Candidatus Nitricoxidivorans perseverans]
MKRWTLLLPFTVMLLAACSKEPAAYMISGSEIAITVERIRPYFWSSGWDMDLIARQHPNCQRRHHLKPTSGDKVKVDVFSPERGVFILRQGKRWYVTDLRTCGFDTFKEPPPEPGELIGTFREKDGTFQFVENKDRAAKAETPTEGE